MKQRIAQYDFLCGIMLLFIIHHHLCGCCALFSNENLLGAPIHSIPYKLLYFYIAYFFYKAGIFYSPKKEWSQVFVDSFKRLLVPYILFTFIGYLLFGAKDPILSLNFWWFLIRQMITSGSVDGNGPMWFLLTLFFVRVIFCTAGENRHIQIMWIVLGACGAIVGYILAVRPRYISTTSMGLVLYGLGYLMRDKQYEKYIGLPMFMVYLLSLFIPSVVDFRFNTLVTGYYAVWAIGSISACIGLNLIARPIAEKVHFLPWLGRHTMPFLCIHALVYEALHILI